MHSIFSESKKAPGLPYLTTDLQRKYPFRGGGTKFIPVLSYNYDYLPMNLESPKVFWVDLPAQAPADFQVGRPVKLLLNAVEGIQTVSNPNSAWNSVFWVDDIVGSRVILSPFRGTGWLPTIHQPKTNPFGWGYSAETANVSFAMHSTPKYGFGAPVASLEYYPWY
jgi:hypothetical protein